MGYYIEATGGKNKAAWLVRYAKGKVVPEATPSADSIPIVVVENESFEVAGIAFDARELARFTRPSDPRPKVIVMVPRDQVCGYCPEVQTRLAW